jgi:hypothetical protein
MKHPQNTKTLKIKLIPNTNNFRNESKPNSSGCWGLYYEKSQAVLTGLDKTVNRKERGSYAPRIHVPNLGGAW